MTEKQSPKPIVLYADDDADDRDLLKMAFAQFSENVELVTTTDGFEAISYLTNIKLSGQAPCLIILDINMPRLDGRETLRKIRSIKRFANTPVALFSTSTAKLDKEFAERYNAGFITKPLDYGRLTEVAEQFVTHCSDEIKQRVQKRAL